MRETFEHYFEIHVFVQLMQLFDAKTFERSNQLLLTKLFFDCCCHQQHCPSLAVSNPQVLLVCNYSPLHTPKPKSLTFPDGSTCHTRAEWPEL